MTTADMAAIMRIRTGSQGAGPRPAAFCRNNWQIPMLQNDRLRKLTATIYQLYQSRVDPEIEAIVGTSEDGGNSSD
ncbi:MAG: hypothetical protein R3D03_13275 [Geminicoccaceae bacterium]